jgi:PKD repeat protein
MKLHFRQGIVRYQTDINAQPTFLQKSTLDSQFVDVIVSPTATIITFAHHDANYVFEEPKTVQRAWGPFTTSQTVYLYWDINVLTAAFTRGATLYPPIYSGVAPSAPALDQHWFDMVTTTMFVWDGVKWIEKIRVFAAVYSSSSVIKPFALGSQAGLNVEIEAGNILLDGFFKPLRQSDGSFLTSTVNMSVVGLATKKVKVEAELLELMALENLAMFDCVQVREGSRCILARNTDRMTRVFGIAMEDMDAGETSSIVTSGLIRSDTWHWPAQSVNRPLFCGQFGELTLIPPTRGVLQQVGSVYDTDAIHINIFPSITLDDSVVAPPPPAPPGNPVANFSTVPLVTSGPAPLTVNFVNVSSNGPFITTEWDFTNDGVVDSTLPEATYTYTTPGTYNVRLRVTNPVGWSEEIKTGYITVDPGTTTTQLANLSIRFNVDGQDDTNTIRVQSGNTFGIKLLVSNSGNLAATNVQRVFTVYDMAGQQVTVSSPPAGATVARIVGAWQITFAPIASLGTSASTDYPPFILQAPNIRGTINMTASVSSPENDSDASNNTRAVAIEVKP